MLDVEEETLAEQYRLCSKRRSTCSSTAASGHYVKSSERAQADVGDRTNDAVRVDGRELECRVVGEGGNLGLPARGIVEYALGGEHIYMDAADNSAGVTARTTSEHKDPTRLSSSRMGT